MSPARQRWEKEEIQADSVGQRHHRRQVEKNVGVIVHAIDGNGGHFLVAANPCNIRPQLREDFVNDLMRRSFTPNTKWM